MLDGVRCPYCKKKLMEALHGTASIRCRHCKHLVSIVGDDLAEAPQPLKRIQITGVATTGDNRFVGTDFKAR